VAEVRLLAGQAYQTGKTMQWVPRIRDLSSDRNEQNRMKVAELLACCDAATATALVREALASPNPLLRREAARVIESKSLADPTLMRRLLGDSDEVVRMLGAGATLGTTQPSTSATR
jgi:HEAT repeat protein